MAFTGQTWAQTVQPLHWMGSITAFFAALSNDSAGQPVLRHLRQAR